MKSIDRRRARNHLLVLTDLSYLTMKLRYPLHSRPLFLSFYFYYLRAEGSLERENQKKFKAAID